MSVPVTTAASASKAISGDTPDKKTAQDNLFSDLPSRWACFMDTCGNYKQCRMREDIGKRFKTCSRCHSAKYCSAECQKACWPAHRGTCKNFQKSKANCVKMDEDAARRRQAAGPLQQNFSLAAGLSLAKEGDLLEKWASDYGQILYNSAIQALELYKYSHPVPADRYHGKVVRFLLKLRPGLDLGKIKSRSACLIDSVDVVSADYFWGVLCVGPTMEAQRKALKDSHDAYLAKGDAHGVITFAICMNTTALPIGSKLPSKMAGSAGIPNWLQLLKDLVATGKGMAGLKDLKGWNLQPERNKMDSYLEFMACVEKSNSPLAQMIKSFGK